MLYFALFTRKRGIKTYRTIKTKLPLQLRMNSLTIIIGHLGLVWFANRKTRKKHLYNQISRQFVNKTSTIVCLLVYMTNSRLRDKFCDTGVDFEKCTLQNLIFKILLYKKIE